GQCIRLEIAAAAGQPVLAFLTQALRVDSADIFSIPGPLALRAFMRLADLPCFDRLEYERWQPQASPVILPGTRMFEVLRARDVHHRPPRAARRGALYPFRHGEVPRNPGPNL